VCVSVCVCACMCVNPPKLCADSGAQLAGGEYERNALLEFVPRSPLHALRLRDYYPETWAEEALRHHFPLLRQLMVRLVLSDWPVKHSPSPFLFFLLLPLFFSLVPSSFFFSLFFSSPSSSSSSFFIFFLSFFLSVLL
jgi:hypothetical protein